MVDNGGDQGAVEAGSKPSLPRAHKRCINKICKEVLSLATKVREGSGRRLPPPLPLRSVRLLLSCSRCYAAAAAAAAAGAAVLQEM
jgi:hypothetical protein